jgi:FAD/FMN-containing dehydrogenase
MAQNYSKDLLKALSDIVGERYVTADPIATFPYTYDASIFWGTEAAIVVRPGSTGEVSQIVKLANKMEVPLVVRGGGASIYGQPRGIPRENVLVDMTRMNQVISVNAESMTVTTQCGIIMGKLQTACKKEGFYIFSPFAPLHIVSLGGWMSGAAGSAGLWTDIVSITVVLPDGTVVTTGGGPGTNVHQPLFYNRNLGGFDAAGLFIGDGGSFGIKTEATVRITPYPPVLRATIFAFRDLDIVLEMVKRHVGHVNTHPFDPILVFGAGAMKNFMGDSDTIAPFTVQGMMQGHSDREMDVKKDAFNALAEELGGARTPELDAMAEAIGSSTAESESTMDWLSTFNGFGLAAWLPFTLPRQGFAEVYYKLIAWRTARLEEAAKRGYAWNGTWEFFTSVDPSTLIGEIDVFFRDAENPEVVSFARTMMHDFQLYAHSIGSIDVYNQGFMSDLHATYWSPGYRKLFQTIKAALDPHNILNPDLWTPLKQKG